MAPGSSRRRRAAAIKLTIGGEPSEQMLRQGAAVITLSASRDIDPGEIAREVWRAMAAQRKTELEGR